MVIILTGAHQHQAGVPIKLVREARDIRGFEREAFGLAGPAGSRRRLMRKAEHETAGIVGLFRLQHVQRLDLRGFGMGAGQ